MTTNCVASCSYHKECPSYEMSKCSSLNYMGSCSKLNQYLIKASPEDRRENVDYHTDTGLLRLLKK